MITERKALVRQLQAMFHEHLVGIYRWDEARIAKPIDAPREPGKPREAGKFLDQISMRLGPLDIEVVGPAGDPAWPCGKVEVKCGRTAFSGPLDAVSWKKVAEFIKEHREEENHGAEIGEWGSG